MNILYIDTAMNACCVAAYAAAGARVAVREEHRARGQAERLMPLIDETMSEAGLTPQDLDVIAVTIGPGTFTGLRVGMSAARVMGKALNVPVVPLTTLELVSAQALPDAAAASCGALAVILESKRSDYYICIRDAGGDEYILEPSALEGADIVKRLAPYDKVFYAGDAVRRYKEEAGLPDDEYIKNIHCADPRFAIEYIKKKCSDKNFIDNNRVISPLYLRNADVSIPKHIRHIEKQG